MNIALKFYDHMSIRLKVIRIEQKRDKEEEREKIAKGKIRL